MLNLNMKLRQVVREINLGAKLFASLAEIDTWLTKGQISLRPSEETEALFF